MTVFSGQTDASEVRCDLTDRQTDRPNYSNPPVHACQGLMIRSCAWQLVPTNETCL